MEAWRQEDLPEEVPSEVLVGVVFLHFSVLPVLGTQGPRREYAEVETGARDESPVCCWQLNLRKSDFQYLVKAPLPRQRLRRRVASPSLAVEGRFWRQAERERIYCPGENTQEIVGVAHNTLMSA